MERCVDRLSGHSYEVLYESSNLSLSTRKRNSLAQTSVQEEYSTKDMGTFCIPPTISLTQLHTKGILKMPTYNFKNDLKVAKHTENEMATFLKRRYKATILKQGNEDGRFDLLVRTSAGIDVAIEMKEDFLTQKTGNVAVEFECRGKPSGINTTQSDLYIYKNTLSRWNFQNFCHQHNDFEKNYFRKTI
jgi:hypothetical protein